VLKEAMVSDSLYERDYYTWALEQAHALQGHRVEDLDWQNLAEELGDLGRSEARSLRSQLARLLAHLLKWHLESSRRRDSRRASVRDARREVREMLDESPGLKSRLEEFFERAYRKAVDLACEETNSDPSRFPDSCPWTFERAMDDKFWPEKQRQRTRTSTRKTQR
jgi:hypothetical protein